MIDAVLEWIDPAVEQLPRFDALAAEIVEQEGAAVRLQMQRRFVVAAALAIGEIESLQGQIATDDDEGTPHAYPPAIDRRPVCCGLRRHRLMALRIEHPHHVAIDRDA